MAVRVLEVRVIAGEAKGRKLKSVHSTEVRPSADRVKEAIFSTLQSRVGGARVLDLYAGSGALGIEALSRGAREAVFVEHDREALQMIRDNLEATRFTDRATVYAGTVERFLAEGAAEPFDIVLVDPPYALGLPSGVLESLAAGGYLKGETVIALEASSRKLSLDVPEGFEVSSERRYGDTAVLYISVVDEA